MIRRSKCSTAPREGFAAAIKISPRDYFPDFPNNSAAARLNRVPVVFEFEAFAENTGWGMMPNCRAREYCDRVAYVRGAQAHGIMTRINWEGVWGWSAINCTSDINIFALSELSRIDGRRDAGAIFESWLSSRYGCTKGPLRQALAEVLDDSFNCIRAIYWHGNIFPRHSQLPKSWQQGWWSMQDHALTNWVSDGSHDADFVLSSDNLARLTADKAQAVARADALCERATALLSAPDLPDGLARDLLPAFANLPVYMRAFDAATDGTFHAKRFEIDGNEADRSRAHAAARRLRDLAQDYQARIADHADTDAAHVAAIMFDPDSLTSFAASLEDV